MRSPRIDVYRDTSRQWRWRFLSNGHVLADSGQGYGRRRDAVNGLEQTLGGIAYFRSPREDYPPAFATRISNAVNEPPESERPVLLRRPPFPAEGAVTVRSERVPIRVLP